MIYHTSSVSETEDLGASLAQTLRPGSFIALYGDLGVGKTAFVRGAAKVLCPGENVCSPSYSIINRYDGAIPVYHIDLYRIIDEEDLYSTGYFDIPFGSSVVFCEWCERCPGAVPDGALHVAITRDGDGRRIETDDTCDRHVV